jgi:hypothetical protein
MIDIFPLQWPAHVRRTPSHKRACGAFQVTPDRAVKDLVHEVRRSGGTGLVISTNRPVRRNGMPLVSSREPDDPGVAVYFTRKHQNICIPCDSFDRVWKNIRAISLSIADMRGPESRGCAAITDQAFTGFLARLPELRGKHLACFCKPGTPCHADVLLEMANKEDSP